MSLAIKLLFTGAVLLSLSASVTAKVPAVSALPKATERSFYVNYRLVLAADGKIEVLTLQSTQINIKITDSLEQQIRSWTFTPGSIEGKPVQTETNLFLMVTATPNLEGKYDLRVTDAGTGSTSTKGVLAAPKYPVDQLRMGNQAVLRLEVTYDADGNVIGVIRPGKKIKGMAPFEQASFNAAKNWHFEPERVGGIGVPGKVIVPVRYCIPPDNCAFFLKGSKEKEKLAQELAQQTVPTDSRVAIQRPTL
jgi:TonB family protein